MHFYGELVHMRAREQITVNLRETERCQTPLMVRSYKSGCRNNINFYTNKLETTSPLHWGSAFSVQMESRSKENYGANKSIIPHSSERILHTVASPETSFRPG